MEKFKTLDEIQRDHTIKVLRHFHGNRTITAKMLGRHVRWLRTKIVLWKSEGYDIPKQNIGRQSHMSWIENNK